MLPPIRVNSCPFVVQIYPLNHSIPQFVQRAAYVATHRAGQLHILLRRLDTRVTQKLLHRAQINSIQQEMRRKTMSKSVRRHPLDDPGRFHPNADRPARPFIIQTVAATLLRIRVITKLVGGEDANRS